MINFSRRSVLLMPLAFAACGGGASVINLAGRTMGTTYSITAVDETNSLSQADLSASVETALAEVDQQMSNWNPSSEISRFNAQTGSDAVTLSPALYDVMAAAETVHLASDGRFDTTMGPLIELWGFGASGAQAMPGDAQIASAMERAGHARVLGLGDRSLQKRHADAQVYLAAIGKGYGADHVGRALEAHGVKNYMVEIGGDIYAAGHNPDGLPWQIGIETPTALNRGVYSVVGVSGLGLASSGDYRNYFEKDGQRYSHVIDPVTGQPITHRTVSTTVLADNAMLADAWSTAMLVLGRERGLEIADANDIAVIFIEADGEDAKFTSATSARYDALVG